MLCFPTVASLAPKSGETLQASPFARMLAEKRNARYVASMKNIQIIDNAINATFSLFQAMPAEFDAIFPDGRDMELAEDLMARLGSDEAARLLARLWDRPILKRDAMGIHGTLFFGNEYRRGHIPATKREVDWDASVINPAQRALFSRHRG